MLAKNENLKDLKNVGKATLRDLNILGIFIEYHHPMSWFDDYANPK